MTLIEWQLQGPLLFGSSQLGKISTSLIRWLCQITYNTQMHMQPGKPTVPMAELPLWTAHVRIRSCQEKSFKEILFYFRTMLVLDLTLSSYNSQFMRLLYQSRITVLLGELKLTCNIYSVSHALLVLADIALLCEKM